MIQFVSSNPTLKQMLEKGGYDLRWKFRNVGRNGQQYLCGLT